MTNTKAEPGYFDGLQRAEEDEPVFPLRAHDVLSDGLVNDWSDRKRALILKAFEAGEIDAAKKALELEQCRDADAIAMDMIAWRKGQAEAAPVEEAKASKPTYSGHAKTEEEIAAKALYDLTTDTVRALDNATAIVSEAAGARLPDWDRGAITVLNYAGSLLKAVADHIRPKRRSYAIGDEPPGAFDVGALPHPTGLLNDPEYLAELASMSEEDKARMRAGDWEDGSDGGPGRTSIKKSLRAEGRNFIG